MLLATLQSNAQEVKSSHSNGFANTMSFLVSGNLKDEVAKWKVGSDTLEIFYGKIKYIKIGTEVFKITSPSLEKVEPLHLGPIYKQFWPNNFQPTNTRTENL